MEEFEMKKGKIRRGMGIFLAAALVLGGLSVSPAPVARAQENGDGLCAHHAEHTAECGYIAPAEGVPCSHEHTDGCYAEVRSCVHEHTPECYPESSVSDNDLESSDAGEPSNCTHECSQESGCIKTELNCQHVHDDECGYVPAVEGTPCSYVCAECGEETSDPADEEEAVTVERVQEMLDGLPDAGETTEDNAEDVKAQLEAIDEAKANLTDEQLEELDITRYIAAVKALEALAGMAGAGEPKILTDEAVASVTIDGVTTTYSVDGDYATAEAALRAAWNAAQGQTATVMLLKSVELGGSQSTSTLIMNNESSDVTLAMEDGVVLSNNGSPNVGVITVEAGSLTINSGILQTRCTTGYVNGIYVTGSKSMVTICGNAVINADSSVGTGVYVKEGTVNIKGDVQVNAKTAEEAKGLAGNTIYGVHAESGKVTIGGNAKISASSNYNTTYGVYTKLSSEIQIEGNAEIVGTGGEQNKAVHGVGASNSTVDIFGEAKIRAYCTTGNSYSYGVYTDNSETNIYGSAAIQTEHSGGAACGVRVSGKRANIYGDVKIISSGAGNSGSYGLHAERGAEVTVSGGTISADTTVISANDSKAYGIYVTSYYTIDNILATQIAVSGNVKITAEGTDNSQFPSMHATAYGISLEGDYSYNSVEISGNVAVEAADYGVFVSRGTAAISGGTFTGSQYGLRQSGNGTVRLSGGTFSAGAARTGYSVYASKPVKDLLDTTQEGKTFCYYEGTEVSLETLIDDEAVLNAYNMGIEKYGTVTVAEELKPLGVSITTESSVVSEGQTVTFQATVTGAEAPTYQWQVSKDGGDNWTDISGATGATYTIANATTDMSGWKYRCIVADGGKNVGSNAETLTVKSSDTSVQEVSVDGTAGTVDNDKKTVTVVLPHTTEELPTDSDKIAITLADSNAAFSTPQTTDNGSTWTFTVTAEDGTTETYTIQVSIAPVPQYTLTVNGSYAKTSGAGSYPEGETVTISAGTRSGYVFAGWTSDDGVTFDDAGNETTTFTMPGSAVTVTANWKRTGGNSGNGGSGGDNGNSGNGGSGNGNTDENGAENPGSGNGNTGSGSAANSAQSAAGGSSVNDGQNAAAGITAADGTTAVQPGSDSGNGKTAASTSANTADRLVDSGAFYLILFAAALVLLAGIGMFRRKKGTYKEG